MSGGRNTALPAFPVYPEREGGEVGLFQYGFGQDVVQEGQGSGTE
jgi:hypothetical protein